MKSGLTCNHPVVRGVEVTLFRHWAAFMVNCIVMTRTMSVLKYAALSLAFFFQLRYALAGLRFDQGSVLCPVTF